MSFESKMTEQKYRDLFEKAGEAVLVFVEGKTVFHNPASRNLFGMSEDEPTGLSIGAFVHPEDRDMVLDYYGVASRAKNFPGPTFSASSAGTALSDGSRRVPT